MLDITGETDFKYFSRIMTKACEWQEGHDAASSGESEPAPDNHSPYAQGYRSSVTKTAATDGSPTSTPIRRRLSDA